MSERIRELKNILTKEEERMVYAYKCRLNRDDSYKIYHKFIRKFSSEDKRERDRMKHDIKWAYAYREDSIETRLDELNSLAKKANQLWGSDKSKEALCLNALESIAYAKSLIINNEIDKIKDEIKIRQVDKYLSTLPWDKQIEFLNNYSSD